MRKVADAFSSCQAAGLFALAASNSGSPLSPALSYWRDFASRYLSHLCRTPESAESRPEPIEPPFLAELSALKEAAPPMVGGEYLNTEVLHHLWTDLDDWVTRQIATSASGLSAWLKKFAPAWHQVGRVCFHLAENKNDPRFPFAFLATYAPRLSKAGQVQYQPLGRALQEYAGQRNKKALISLLSPVQTAAEKSPFVKKLVDSGNVFHALAWSPKDAYTFLQTIPLLEASGILVRVPDWWQKRPRPRIAVTMGDRKHSRLGTETMLDFKVELALGEERLTEEEWRQLMEAEDGLVNVKGKWVEIDREKLSEALSHWKRVEKQAGRDGISFIEGMRLLAGAPNDLDPEGVEADQSHQWAFVDAGNWLSDVLAALRDPARIDSAGPSRSFCGRLRPYQVK